MNILSLGLLYLLIGMVCAMAIYRRHGRRKIVRAALALPLWPLWAPIILADTPRPTCSPTDLPTRIEQALGEGVQASSGSPLQALLNGESAARIIEMTRRTADRHTELSQLLSRSEFCRKSAYARVEKAEHSANPRSLATARLHVENIERLLGMASRDRAVLQELTDLAEALRTQLLMTRFAGASADGIGDIIGDLWTRVEALSEAMDGPARNP